MLTPKLQTLKELSGPKYGFNGPRYQDVMPDGTLIVADKYTHSVNIVAIDEELLQVIGKGQAAKGPGKFLTLEGVELKGDILCIADPGNDRIVKYRMTRRSKDPHTHGRYRIFLFGALGLRLYRLEASVGSGRRRGRTDRPPAGCRHIPTMTTVLPTAC